MQMAKSDQPKPSKSHVVDASKNTRRQAASRREDYKAYTERDIDDGWPYSDEAGGVEERLQGNRPYASEEILPQDTSTGPDGWHVENAPIPPIDKTIDPDAGEDIDETVREYIDEADDEAGKA
jgi:hypothetical protein